MKQNNVNLVVSGVQTLSLLSELIERSNNGEQMKADDFNLVLRQLSAALISTQKNNLDAPATSKLQTNVCLNISVSTDCNDNSEDDSFMSNNSEACDVDDKSEPEIDYQQELLSRMMYYGEHETEIKTPSKSRCIPSLRSTPLASSTIVQECSRSALRKNKRRNDRSTPLASSTVMEDLLTDVENNQPQLQTGNNSIVTWSIDNDTNTASLKEYYNRHFDCEPSTGFWMHTNADLSTICNSKESVSRDFDSDGRSADICNRNGEFPRTSTCTDLLKNINSKPTDEKKQSKEKQHVSRLMHFVRKIKRNLTKKNSSKE